jgi:flagellin
VSPVLSGKAHIYSTTLLNILEDNTMTTINTNIAAMTAANSIKTNDRSMSVAMERLSTGLRINSASDDAAGLAIATKMTSQIRGLDAAARNANDAISMIQVADGAASEITDMLQRMRELTVQSSNGVNSTADRANLDQEFVQLAQAIDKIAETTEFNGRKILNGDADGAGDSTVTFQVGSNSGANEQLDVNFADFNLAAGTTAGTQGVDTLAITTASVTAGNIFVLTDVEGNTITVSDANIVTARNTLGSGVGTNLQDADYDVLALAINTAIDANANFAQMTAANSGANTITFTQDVAGSGSILAANQIDSSSVGSALNSGSVSSTTVGSATGGAGNPMAADISAFSSTGIDESNYTDTLDKLDAALVGVASQRATFGAAINTLEHTVDNLVTTSANQSAARSQIQDADYAAETTALARTQIISQASTAMLSQANQASQGVLALLR